MYQVCSELAGEQEDVTLAGVPWGWRQQQRDTVWVVHQGEGKGRRRKAGRLSCSWNVLKLC